MTSQFEALGETVYERLDNISRIVLARHVLLYIFRMESAQDFNERLAKLGMESSEITALRMRMQTKGTILREFKTFAYGQITGNHEESEISVEDKKLIVRILERDPILAKTLRQYQRQGYSWLSNKQMGLLVERMRKENDAYTGKFSNAKLRFIMNMESKTLDDMKQELFGYALYSVYRAYPRYESFLHVVNIGKQAVHNRGINLIMEATAKSRTSLVRNPDGTFTSLRVPYHSLFGAQTPSSDERVEHLTQCNYLMVGMSGKSANMLPIHGTADDVDLKISVNNVFEKLAEWPEAERLARLWGGEYDAELSQKLGVPNDEWHLYMERIEYVKQCVSHLGVSQQQALNQM